MEPRLTETNAQAKDLLALAAYHAQDAQARCIDVASMAFPNGHLVPSEELLASVGAKLRAIVIAIENRVKSEIDPAPMITPYSWDILVKSGFLREPALIDFLLARYAEDRLLARIAQNGDCDTGEQLPAKLINHDDALICETAQSVLASETIGRKSLKLLYCEMSPEQLHQLVWRIIAALQISSGARNDDHINAAKAMLASYDEGQIGKVAARKLVHFIRAEYQSQLADPQQAGLTLFVSFLASKTQLDHDHVLRLIDSHSSAPLAIMLRMCGLPREEAMAIICLFKGFDLTPNEITLFDEHYAVIDSASINDQLEKWSNDRFQFLSFGGATSAPEGQSGAPV
jgi:hypothetical protein